MDPSESSLPEPWILAVREQVRLRPAMALGLIFSLVALVGLLVQGLGDLVLGGGPPFLRYAVLGGLAGLGATALGALPALGFQTLRQRTEDMLLGAAAGMMLAATSFSLLLPGLEAGGNLAGSKGLGAATVVFGMALGVLLMLGLDALTPHEHDRTGPCGPGHARCGRVWLFVFAIALHNLPEGMAIGVGFARGDLSVGLPLATAISLQDLPEGLAVALALRGAGLTPRRAVGVAAATGCLEFLGALLGIGLASGFPLAYPVGLGLAAGAMLFVVSHEVIPETHRNGHQTPATLGLMAGFALMMVLDMALG